MRRLSLRLLWAAFLLPFLTPSAVAQSRADPPKNYAAVVEALDRFVAREVADKRLPALSIALVDDQAIIWAKGYGSARLEAACARAGAAQARSYRHVDAILKHGLDRLPLAAEAHAQLPLVPAHENLRGPAYYQ